MSTDHRCVTCEGPLCEEGEECVFGHPQPNELDGTASSSPTPKAPMPLVSDMRDATRWNDDGTCTNCAHALKPTFHLCPKCGQRRERLSNPYITLMDDKIPSSRIPCMDESDDAPESS